MDYKKELKRLVDLIKSNAKEEGLKIRNEDIAKRMAKGRTYLSDLLNVPGKPVNKKHVDNFKIRFADELNGVFKPAPPGDPFNRERAQVKAYRLRIAKLEAMVYNRSLEECLKDLDRDTMTFQEDLEKEA